MAVTYRRWDADDSVSAQWFTVLDAARKAGVSFLLNDGHRTMAEQQVLFEKSKHGGALAAFPSPTAPHIRTGRPDHALDVNAVDGGAGRLATWSGTRGARDVPRTQRALAHRGAARRPQRLARKPADLLAGYPAKERHWIRALMRSCASRARAMTRPTGRSGAPGCAA